MDYNVLKDAIKAYVKDRTGLDTIDGDGLQETLLAIVNSIGVGYVFMGVANLTTNPGTPDQRVWYLASTAGIYANFNNTVLNQYEIAVLKWDTEWHKEVIPDIASKSQIDERLNEQDGRLDGQDARLDDQDEEIADFEEAVQNQVDNYPMITINGNVTNAPDEEDITTDENDLLKFKNRSAVDGMGYVILRKGGSNTFANQVTEANTIYEIRYDFDLGGASVTIPAGCVLEFDGGSLNNGIVIGNNTIINGQKGCLQSISFGGTWNCSVVYSTWWKNLSETNALKQVFNLQSDAIHNTIIIEAGTYSVDLPNNQDSLCVCTSNTEILLNDATINMVASYAPNYYFFYINQKSNVTIKGNGMLVGDKAIHTGTEGEGGNGICANDSTDVIVDGLTIKDFWGDCIYVRAKTTTFEDGRIIIQNCKLSNGRRQGISVVGTYNVLIENCRIEDIAGAAPQSAIDFEPNENFYGSTYSVINTIINNCVKGICVNNGAKQVSVDNCRISTTAQAVDIEAGEIALFSNSVIYSTNTDECIKLRNVTANFNGCVINSANSSFIIKIFDSVGHKTTFNACKISGTIPFYVTSGLVVDGCIINGTALYNTNQAFSENKVCNSEISIPAALSLNGAKNVYKNNIFSGTTIAFIETESVFEGNTIKSIYDCRGIRSIIKDNIFEVQANNDPLRIRGEENKFVGNIINYVIDDIKGRVLLTLKNHTIQDNRFVANTAVIESENGYYNNVSGNNFIINSTITIQSIYTSIFNNNVFSTAGGYITISSANYNYYAFNKFISNLNNADGIIQFNTGYGFFIGNHFINKRSTNISYAIKLGDSISSLSILGSRLDKIDSITSDNTKCYISDVLERNQGTAQQSASQGIAGQSYFRTDYKRPLWCNGTYWFFSDGMKSDTKYSGTFAQKPTSTNNIYVGFPYFCTNKQTAEGASNGIMIYYKGQDTTDPNNPVDIWVDALGRVVS